jgi:sugar (pentulose or hexulose) kinase
MEKVYLIGTDIGTSSTKSILMDTSGRLHATSLVEYEVLMPKTLHAEQWPDIWVDAVKKTIREVVVNSGAKPQNVAGICISGLYGGSGVPCDEKMNAVRPCMIWMDRRAVKESKWVMDTIGAERLYSITTNGADPYYGFTKILWIKNNEPENWCKIKVFLPPNHYAIYKLTKEVCIDQTSAGNIGGIFDMKKREWSVELLDAMDIPVRFMPERIVRPGEIVGHLTDETAKEVGLITGTPVCSGGVDCLPATLGAGVFEPGQHVAMIGTSMGWGYVHDKPLSAKNLVTMPYVIDSDKLDYTFGGAATAGALLKWFRGNFAQLEVLNERNGKSRAYKVLDKDAEKVGPGSMGLVILPYFMGERAPIWDVNARGVIFGLTLFHTKAHVYRALMESVAYSLKHTIENVQIGSSLGDKLIITGGVTKSRLWRKIFADVTGYPVLCPGGEVEAPLGDIFLAGAGTGVIDYRETKKWVKFDEMIVPDKELNVLYDKYYEQYKDIYSRLKGNMENMALISSGSPDRH